MDRNNKIESVIDALSNEHLTATKVNLNIENINLTVNEDTLNNSDTNLSHFTDSDISNDSIENFIFSPLQIASHDYKDDDGHLNNWISIDDTDDHDATDTVTSTNQWNDGIDQGDLLNKETLSRLFNIYKEFHLGQTPSAADSVYKYYGNDIPISETWKYSRRVHLEGDDKNPAYSSRGVLPIFNSNNDVKFYVKIRHIGSSGTGGSSKYNLWGIGIMRKFNSFDDDTKTPKEQNVDSNNTDLKNSWDTSNNNVAAAYALRPQDPNHNTGNSKIFQSNKIMIRMRGDTNLYSKEIDVPFYGRLNDTVSNSSTGIKIKDFYGNSEDISTTLSGGGYGIIGHDNMTTPIDVTGATYNNGIYTISTASNISGSKDEYIGFTKLTGDFTVNNIDDGGQPSGMGYNYHKSYGTSKTSTESGESKAFADWAQRGDGTGSSTQPTGTTAIIPSKMDDNKLDALKVVDGVVGFEITSAISVNTDRTKPIRIINFYGQKDGADLGNGVGVKVKLAQKEIPELYFDGNKKLNKISDMDSNSLLDGPWCPFVFDSTGSSITERDITLEIIKPI